MRRVDKHFVCHVRCAPRRSRRRTFPPVLITGGMRSNVGAPDNESRAWFGRDSSSQATAGKSFSRGL
ncbi:hypothetical protein RGR602_CH01536 [Rhizobium gallicum bv. gallicum R602sp]|uniref:Uncharacterized protein n=1 Tax=Rhizobium gallicum bv. gallicum R602sp TaxID=1041138 RepID=A0A0B4X314_9HYPH|nr:hypothetical protein RGR602_CH01536 [Rhizobium gallicum bv. gallicum R602sp]